MAARFPSVRARARAHGGALQVNRALHDNRDVHSAHLARARMASHRSGQSGPFRRFSRAASTAVGRPWAFVAAVSVVVLWAALGPLFHFSDTWQLVINTGTTIITFLMVFLIQNTQNRDTEALRLKLDELILATRAARNEFIDIDDLSDTELSRLERELRAQAQQPDDRHGNVARSDVLTAARSSEAKH